MLLLSRISPTSTSFAIYKDFFSDLIPVLKNNIGKKQIHFCPYTGHLLNGHSKYEFRDQLIKTIKSVWSECRIADLIEEDAVYREVVLNLRANDNFISVIKLNPPYDLMVDLSENTSWSG